MRQVLPPHRRQPQGRPAPQGTRHVHELHRLDGQDFSRKEEADIQHVLEAALHILLVAGSTPDAGQRLEANEEGADDPVPSVIQSLTLR